MQILFYNRVESCDLSSEVYVYGEFDIVSDDKTEALKESLIAFDDIEDAFFIKTEKDIAFSHVGDISNLLEEIVLNSYAGEDVDSSELIRKILLILGNNDDFVFELFGNKKNSSFMREYENFQEKVETIKLTLK